MRSCKKFVAISVVIFLLIQCFSVSGILSPGTKVLAAGIGSSDIESLDVGVGGIPELIISSISWTPSNPEYGQEVKFSATLENAGTRGILNEIIKVNFYVDGKLTNWADVNIDSLMPDSSITVEANNGPTGKATWTSVNGMHTVLAYADEDKVLFEADCTNNTLTENITVINGVQIYSVSADSTPPSSPTNVRIHIKAPKTVCLTWDKVYDTSGISGYRIYRTGFEGYRTADTTYFADTGLTPGNTYSYQVSAIDGEGNESLLSDTVKATTSTGVLLITESNLYDADQQFVYAIRQYKEDLQNEGYTVYEERVNCTDNDPDASRICKTPDDLKDMIRGYYNSTTTPIDGFVIIGSAPAIPAAIAENDDYYKTNPTYGPSDVFYADMNGQWQLNTDDKGSYYTFVDTVRANISPELFWGRITPYDESGSKIVEAQKIIRYLDRIHKYRTGTDFLTQEEQERAQLFTASLDYTSRGIWDISRFFPVASNVKCNMGRYTINKEAYLDMLASGYQFIHMYSHSSNTSHGFETWKDGTYSSPSLTIDELEDAVIRTHHIGLTACKALKFADREGNLPYLGEKYLFGKNSLVLNAVGVTESIYFVHLDEDEYRDMAVAPVGLAAQRAMVKFYGNTDYEGGGFLGDPTLTYRINKKTNQPPKISTNIAYNEVGVRETFRFPILVLDPDSTSVHLKVEGLPGQIVEQDIPISSGAGDYEVVWQPAEPDLGKTYKLLITLTDDSGNVYKEETSVYISYINNGLLNRGGISTQGEWSIEGTLSGYYNSGESVVSPAMSALRINQYNNSGALKQSVNVEPNTSYILKFWGDNEMTQNSQSASVSVKSPEGSTTTPINKSVICPNSKEDLVSSRVVFYTYDNSTVDIYLNAGEATGPCYGTVYYSGLRLVKDVDPPSAPQYLHYVNKSPTSVSLNWEQSYDNSFEVEYDIYRDGIYITTVPNTSYTDTGLTAGNRYQYAVYAKDGNNNKSASNTIDVIACTEVQMDILKFAKSITGSSDAITGLPQYCFDRNESSVFRVDTRVAENNECAYVTIQFPTPVSITKLRTLVGKMDMLMYGVKVESADTLTDLDYQIPESSYVKNTEFTDFVPNGNWNTVTYNYSEPRCFWKIWIRNNEADYMNYIDINEIEIYADKSVPSYIAAYNYGDTNLDGVIDEVDEENVKKIIGTVLIPSFTQMAACDVDKNNIINSTDLAYIQRYIPGIINTFPAGKANTIAYGDVNFDKVIDMDDYYLLKELILNETATFEQQVAADLDGNNTIDSVDLVILQRYVYKIYTSFPVGE